MPVIYSDMVDLLLLFQVIKENDNDREEDRLRPHDPISEHLLWLMMHHIRRSQVFLSLQLNVLLILFS